MVSLKRDPDFNQLKMVLTRSGEPQRVPFFELFADGEIMAHILGKPVRNMNDLLEYHLKIGYDYFPGIPSNIDMPMKGCMSYKDSSDDPSKKRTYRTASMQTIKSWEDFEAYPWPETSAIDYSQIEKAEKIIPGGMKLIVPGGHILEDPIGLLGYEGLSFLSVDNPELVQAVFKRVGQLYEGVYRDCVQMDSVGAILISDDLGFKTGTMISPQSLRDLVFPWYRRYAEISHQYNKPVILHSCGNLEEVMEDIFIYCKIDAKHSFEDQVLSVIEAKRRYGNDISLLGGVDIDFLCRATPKEVKKYTEKVLEECMPGGGYALGTGNSVANYIPVENFLAMLEVGNEVGWY